MSLNAVCVAARRNAVRRRQQHTHQLRLERVAVPRHVVAEVLVRHAVPVAQHLHLDDRAPARHNRAVEVARRAANRA
jgi:hypothetical protein